MNEKDKKSRLIDMIKKEAKSVFADLKPKPKAAPAPAKSAAPLNINWFFVLGIAGTISAIIILIAGFIIFNTERKERLTGGDEARAALKISADSLLALSFDSDGDGVFEPPAPFWQGKPGEAFSFIPNNTGVSLQNKNNVPYLYCAWDLGAKTDPLRYLVLKPNAAAVADAATPGPENIVLALVDAGRNKKFESSCGHILQKRQGYGDDVAIVYTFAQLQSQMREPRKTRTRPTCAFGQVYEWNAEKRSWECQIVPPEESTSMPAGCPEGQVLVRYSGRIYCENSVKITGVQEQAASTPRLAQPSQQAAATPGQTAASAETTQQQQAATALPPPGTTTLAPAAPQQTGQNAQTAAQSAQTEQNVQAFQQAYKAPSQNNSAYYPAQTGGANNTPQNAQQYAAGQQVPQAAPVYRQMNNYPLSQPANPSGAASPSYGANTASQQPQAQATQAAPQSYRAPLPGAAPTVADNNYAGLYADAAANAGTATAASAHAPADDSKIEITVQRRVNPRAMQRICKPNIYLPRTAGVFTQCVSVKSYGEFFGPAAKQSVWPSLKQFLYGAFIYCPAPVQDRRIACRGLNFNRDLDLLAKTLSPFPQGGYICARMNNPLPPPWPQFDSFVYSETVPGYGACRYDQLPMLKGAGAQTRLYCADLAEVTFNFRNNGYCGCGWNLWWNAFDSKFNCG